MIPVSRVIMLTAAVFVCSCDTSDVTKGTSQSGLDSTPGNESAGDLVGVYTKEYLIDCLISQSDQPAGIHDRGRSCRWDADRLDLEIPHFSANIGPNTYQDEDNQQPDYFTIDVEFHEGNSSLVLFSRELPISDLPDGYVSLKAADVVTFDPKTRIVSFDMGEQKFSYQIPAPPNR